MLTVEEETLQYCLEAAGLRTLPPVETDRNWRKGIALVSKMNGTKNYCLVHCHKGEVHIKKDFGSISRISQIIEIRPYEKIDPNVAYTSNDPKEKLVYLTKFGHDPNKLYKLLKHDGKTAEEIARDEAIIQGYIDDAVEQRMRENEAEDERCKKILNDYNERIKINGNKRGRKPKNNSTENQ
jgi:hypothetical protein